MKKIFLLTTLLLQLTFVFGQTLSSTQGIYLGYFKEKYNTVELNGEIYDQYEVTIIFRNSNQTKYLHEPRFCRVSFLPDAKHPTSSSEFDFAQNGEAYGYVEYTDGTPLPENLNSPKEEDKYGRVVSRMILEPNQEDKCIKYILVKSGNEFPEPNWSLEFDNQIPIFVNGSTSLVATWVDRQAKGISLSNVSSWPMIIRKPFDGTNCGNAKPIGNKGEVISQKISVQDIENSLSKSQEEKIKEFKEFFIQNEYKFLNEGKRPDEYTGYIIEFSDFLIQLYYESEDENVGANGDRIGTPIIKIRCNNEASKSKVLKLLNSISNRIDIDGLTIVII